MRTTTYLTQQNVKTDAEEVRFMNQLFRPDIANAIRALTIDAVQQANSGHPGMPMGMADIATVLWLRHLRHNPRNPSWIDRDRFVVSNGHGSMLPYALLHLSGYDLPISELKRFRQLDSKTPGHPEYGVTPGIETTTGPLGQGLANAVGMALAERLLAQEFNRPGFNVVSHYTYVFLGDGCLMEGISHEVCSFAGTLGLGKLIAFYDDNGVSISGPVGGWFSDDTAKRFEAYGWHVVRAVDGHNLEAIDRAIGEAKIIADKPSLICCKTVIGKGSPSKAGKCEIHGRPLGDSEIAATRANLGWSHEPFEIPVEVYATWDCCKSGAAAESEWNELFSEYSRTYPTEGKEFQRRVCGGLPPEFSKRLLELQLQAQARAESVISLKACAEVVASVTKYLPELVGGTVDFGPANPLMWPGCRPVTRLAGGNYIQYGVREFGMAAMMNGIALHRGLIPFGGTFLAFSDYCRNAIRLAALMHLRTLFVLAHDSISLGEDGPTHQPIEHLPALRMIPHLDVWRPCDVEESVVAWATAIERQEGPSCLVHGKKILQAQARAPAVSEKIKRGGYILREPHEAPQAVIVATGPEVSLAVDAQELLAKRGVPVRVVSMPSTNVFDRQDCEYRKSVLPPDLPIVAVEPAATDFWYKYVGRTGAVLGIDAFGRSAPSDELFKLFGLTPKDIAATVTALLEQLRPVAMAKSHPSQNDLSAAR